MGKETRSKLFIVLCLKERLAQLFSPIIWDCFSTEKLHFCSFTLSFQKDLFLPYENSELQIVRPDFEVHIPFIYEKFENMMYVKILRTGLR